MFGLCGIMAFGDNYKRVLQELELEFAIRTYRIGPEKKA